MPAERRRYQRLKARLPVKFRLCGPENGPAHCGVGTLKDISLGGLCFLCPPPAPVRVGQTLDLAIATTPPDLENPSASRLQALSRVVRLDPPGSGPCLGVAVSFLEGLNLYLPEVGKEGRGVLLEGRDCG
jgi:hypothetical protein